MAAAVDLVRIVLMTIFCFLFSTLHSVVGQCSPGKYGEDCRFSCHCGTGVTCNPTSECDGGQCASGWYGPTCQRQNVALNRPAIQSSTAQFSLPSNGTEIPFGAQYAVDGRVGYNLFNTPCTHTEEGHGTAYWSVTLDRMHEVTSFQIYNRDVLGERLNSFILSVGNTTGTNSYTTCYQDQSNTGGPGSLFTSTCQTGGTILGNSVKISLNTGQPLTLCEVQIFACDPGTWGDNCENYCGHCLIYNTCSPKTGNCPVTGEDPVCKAGYQAPQCNTVCDDSYWGPDCEQICDHCWNSAACNKSSGVCPEGINHPRCSAGYQGDGCTTECQDGRYGPDCSELCGNCAQGSTSCNKTTGECPLTPNGTRCLAGYENTLCNTACKDTRWGADCTQKCGHCRNHTACNKVTGICPITEGSPRCNPGYIGEACTQRNCPDNKYGPDCRYVCHCGTEVTCDPLSGCVDGSCYLGWDGDTCQRQNVALNRPAAQSSTGAFGGKSFPAEYAVDGKVGGNLFNTPCTHTASSYPSAEWNVTLTEVTSVYRFRIYNRNTIDCNRPCGARLNNFKLSVGNSSSYVTCYQDTTTDPNGPGYIVNKVCDGGPVWGDQIRVSLDTGEPLNLCEVQIFVCAPGWYGERCEKECSTTTRCLRCDPARIQCIQCVPGFWGEDCEKICDNCWDKVCLKTNGSCVQTGGNPRCQAGYKGSDCTTHCQAGRYGPDCVKSCGQCAEGNLTCSIISGDCPHRDNLPTCAPGYGGKRCDQACAGTDWGMDCIHKCGHCWGNTPCDRTTGVCPVTEEHPRCSAGYLGEYCTQSCSKGTWGENCQLTCSVNCKLGPTGCDVTSGLCIGGCQEGYEGKYCTVYQTNFSTQIDYTPTIVGSVVGVIVAGFGLVLLIFFLRRYQRRSLNQARNREDQFLDTQENSVKQKATGQEMDVHKEGEMPEENTYETVFDRNYENLRNANRNSVYTNLSRPDDSKT